VIASTQRGKRIVSSYVEAPVREQYTVHLLVDKNFPHSERNLRVELKINEHSLGDCWLSASEIVAGEDLAFEGEIKATDESAVLRRLAFAEHDIRKLSQASLAATSPAPVTTRSGPTSDDRAFGG